MPSPRAVESTGVHATSTYLYNGTLVKLSLVQRGECGGRLELVRSFMRAHGDALLAIGVDIDAFQGFEEELRLLPGKYSCDRGGSMWLAEVWTHGVGWSAAGCVALKQRGPPEQAEIKRLFISPRQRGHGFGRLLSLHIIADAVSRGYRSVVLDSLQRQAAAVALYTSMGFRPTAPYCPNPEHDAVYMQLDLQRTAELDKLMAPLQSAQRPGQVRAQRLRFTAWGGLAFVAGFAHCLTALSFS